jgi:hypothetical protein
MSKILSLVLLFFVLQSCKSNLDTATPVQNGPTSQEVAAFGEVMARMSSESNTIWIPDLVKMDTTNLLKGQVLIEIPAGYEYVGVDANDKTVVKSSGSITITCNCTKGGSCEPVSNGNSYGCISNNCQNCTMTVSSSGAGSFKTGGFIKKIGGVEFIKR